MCYLNYFLFLHMPVFESKNKQAAGYSFSLEVMCFPPGAGKPLGLSDPQAALPIFLGTLPH